MCSGRWPSWSSVEPHECDAQPPPAAASPPELIELIELITGKSTDRPPSRLRRDSRKPRACPRRVPTPLFSKGKIRAGPSNLSQTPHDTGGKVVAKATSLSLGPFRQLARAHHAFALEHRDQLARDGVGAADDFAVSRRDFDQRAAGGRGGSRKLLFGEAQH